jgi:hypothetical protein
MADNGDVERAHRRQRRRQVLMAVVMVPAVSLAAGGSFAVSAARDGSRVHPAFGVVAGLLLGLGMAVLLVFSLRRTAPLGRALAVLDREERREVARAVRHGTAVTDPALASAAVLSARLQREPLGRLPWSDHTGTVLMVLGSLVFAAGLWRLRGVSITIGIFMVALGAYTRHLRRRSEQAEHANLGLMSDLGPLDPEPGRS